MGASPVPERAVLLNKTQSLKTLAIAQMDGWSEPRNQALMNTETSKNTQLQVLISFERQSLAFTPRHAVRKSVELPPCISVHVCTFHIRLLSSESAHKLDLECRTTPSSSRPIHEAAAMPENE